jgi:hypothetical protein
MQLAGEHVEGIAEAERSGNREQELLRAVAVCGRQPCGSHEAVVGGQLAPWIAAHTADPVVEGGVLEPGEDSLEVGLAAGHRGPVSRSNSALTLGHGCPHHGAYLRISDGAVDVVIALEVAQIGGRGVTGAVDIELAVQPRLIVVGRDQTGEGG